MACGICGTVGLSDRQLLHSMCDVLRHRGPDSSGYFFDRGVALGTDRLRIIDVPKGDQPIHNEDSSAWITFNGEIYNYLELRGLLERSGHSFYTDSDTETVVHAYEEWGLDFVDHLRGMFAFGLWDGNKRRLVLARDRFGKKPLYYTRDDGVLLFASELKALLQFEGLNRELNFDAVDYYFAYGYVPSPLTIFRNCHKLPPAHYAVFEGGNLTVTRYWDLDFHPDPQLSEEAAVDLLYSALRDGVKVRLQSEVPLGAFLSGGIDSSTVVSLMQSLSETPVKTVSIGFDDALSEVQHSRRVSEYLGTDHREFVVTPRSYEILPRLIWHFDEPFADHSLIPTYYLSEVTRKEVTVALSGDGGDEMFMGYNFLTEPSVFGIYSRVPHALRTTGLRAALSLPFEGDYKRMAQHALEKDYGAQSPSQRYVMRVQLNDDAALRRLYSRDHMNGGHPKDTASYLLKFMDEKSRHGLINAVDYATIRGYLEEDILTKVDRMSMAVSLETRCPMLDQEVVGVVARIPAELKQRGRTTKYILKKMVLEKGLLPKEIVFRKKQGFGAPVTSWMKKDWKDMASQVLDSVVSGNYTGLFDREYVQRLMREPYLNANRIFALLVFVMWHKIYLGETSPRVPPQSVSALIS